MSIVKIDIENIKQIKEFEDMELNRLMWFGDKRHYHKSVYTFVTYRIMIKLDNGYYFIADREFSNDGEQWGYVYTYDYTDEFSGFSSMGDDYQIQLLDAIEGASAKNHDDIIECFKTLKALKGNE